MRCAEVRQLLPGYVREDEPSAAVRRHLARCPKCSAELGRYRSLMMSLQSLEIDVAEPPRGLVDKLVAIPATARRTDHLRAHLNRNRRTYAGAGAAAVALAGAAVGAAVIGRRRRALQPA